MSQTNRKSLLLASGLAAMYAVIGLLVLDVHSLFSIDAAIKLFQAQALRDSQFSSAALIYLGRDLDPTLKFLPFDAPFVFQHGSAIQGVYPIAVALLNALFLEAGLPGLVILSALSALVALAATGHLARSSGARGAILILGVCTPFWAYAVLPWEHMPALACVTVGWMLLETRRRFAWAGAGLALGIGIALRHEVALLVPGLCILYWRHTPRRYWACLCLALMLPLLASAALDVCVYDRPAFSHLSHAVGFVWVMFGHGSSVQRPETFSIGQQLQVVVGDWIFGWPGGTLIGVVVLGLCALAGFALKPFRDQFVMCVLICASVLAIRDLVKFVEEPDFVAGLLRLSPVLLFAILPTADGESESRGAKLVLLGLFVAGLLTSGRHAGAQFGPRFLLPVVPLLAVMSWQGLRSYRLGGRMDPASRVIGLLGALLLACSAAMQLLVGLPALVGLNAGERPVADSLKKDLPTVVLIDDIYLINAVGASYSRTRVLMATTPRAVNEVSAMLWDRRIDRVAFVQGLDAQFELPGFVAERIVRTPRNSLSYWRRE